jgi:hypothetical protein
VGSRNFEGPQLFGGQMRTRDLSRALLVVAVLVLGNAGPAPASSWQVDHVPTAGPTIAGHQVAWVARKKAGPGGDLYLSGPGDAPRRVQAFSAEHIVQRGSLGYVFQLAGSGSDLLLARHRFCVGEDPCSDRDDVFAGSLGERLTRIERCESTLQGVDVSGSFGAFPTCDGPLVVRDFGGRRDDVFLGVQARGGAIAGRYVAWVEAAQADGTSDIVVYDRDAGAIAYTVRRTAVVGNLALRKDGRVVFAFMPNADQPFRVAVGSASPASPKRDRLPLPVRGFYRVRASGERVAFIRASARHFRDRPAEVGVADLQGDTTLLSAHSAASSEIDLRGRLVAYVTRLHHRVTVRTTRLK